MWLAEFEAGSRDVVWLADTVRKIIVRRCSNNFSNQEAHMKLSKSITCIAITVFTAALTAGCNRDNTSAESLGRKIDQAQQNASETMDRATAQVKEQAANAGDKIDDATITAKVKTALIGDTGMNALQINVDTANGVVTDGTNRARYGELVKVCRPCGDDCAPR